MSSSLRFTFGSDNLKAILSNIAGKGSTVYNRNSKDTAHMQAKNLFGKQMLKSKYSSRSLLSAWEQYLDARAMEILGELYDPDSKLRPTEQLADLRAVKELGEKYDADSELTPSEQMKRLQSKELLGNYFDPESKLSIDEQLDVIRGKENIGELKNLNLVVPPSKFDVGDMIESDYKGDGVYEDGIITEDNKDGTYEVTYNDKNLDKQSAKPSSMIRYPDKKLPEIFKVGKPVLSDYRGDGLYRPGKIEKVNGDGTYDIVYDNNLGKEINKPIDMISPLSLDETFRIGDNVESKLNSNDKFYPAKVVNKNDDNTLDVMYKDGIRKDRDLIKRPIDKSKFKVGDEISLDDKIGEITKVNDDITYDMEFDDKNLKPKLSLDEDYIRNIRSKPKFNIGNEVEVNYNNDGKYETGEITKVNQDTTYDVVYDDTDQKSDSPINEDNIRNIDDKPHYTIGDKIEADYNNDGVYQKGEITLAKENKLYDIKYDTFNPQTDKNENLIRFLNRDSKFKVGDKVEVSSSKKDYMKATITAVNIDFKYDIKYDDLESQQDKSENLIRKIEGKPKFNVGDKIEADPSLDNNYKKGKIVSVNDDTTYDIELKDPNQKKTNVKENLLDFKDGKPIYKKGEKVLADFNSEDLYEPGVIKSDNNDGTYDVKYDDGINKPKSEIRKQKYGPLLSPGDPVQANFRGDGEYLDGTILGSNDDGSYNLVYDNGLGTEYNKPANMIRKVDTREDPKQVEFQMPISVPTDENEKQKQSLEKIDNLVNEKQELEEEIERLNNENVDLNKDKNNKNNKIPNIERNISRLDDEKDNLDKKILKTVDNIKDNSKIIDDGNSKLITLESERQDVLAKKNKTDSDIRDHEYDLSKINQNSKRIKNELNSLEDKNKKLSKDLTQTNEKKNDLQNKENKLESDLRVSKVDRDKSIEKKRSLNNEINNLKKDISQKSNLSDELQLKKLENEKKIIQLGSNIDEVKLIEQENDRLSNDIKNIKKDLLDKQSSLVDKQTSYSNADKKFMNSEKNIKDTVVKLNENKKQQKKLDKLIPNIESAISLNKQKIIDLNEDNYRNEKNKEDEIIIIDKLKKDIKSEKNDIKNLDNDKLKVEKEIDRAKKSIIDLESKEESLRKNRNDVQDDIKVNKDDLDDLKMEVTKLEKKILLNDTEIDKDKIALINYDDSIKDTIENIAPKDISDTYPSDDYVSSFSEEDMLNKEIKSIENNYNESLRELKRIEKDEADIKSDKDITKSEINLYKKQLDSLKSDKSPTQKTEKGKGEIDIETLSKINTENLMGYSSEAFEAFLRTKDKDQSDTISTYEAHA